MARTKKQTVKKFLGRRKRINIRRNISVVSEHLSRATEDPVGGTEASPVSASSSKLGYFGITLQALDSNMKMEDGKDDDFYIIVQESSINKVFGNLLCPYCKQPNTVFKVMPESTLRFAVKAKSYCSGCESTISEDVQGTKLRMQMNLSIAQFGNIVQNLCW